MFSIQRVIPESVSNTGVGRDKPSEPNATNAS